MNDKVTWFILELHREFIRNRNVVPGSLREEPLEVSVIETEYSRQHCQPVQKGKVTRYYYYNLEGRKIE